MEFHYFEPKSNYSGLLVRCNVQSQSTPPLIMGQACFKGITAIVFQTAKVKIYCAFSTCSYFHVLPRDPNKFLHVSICLRETLGVKFPEKSFFCTACSSSVYLKTTYSFVLQAKIRNRRKSGSKLLSSSKVGSSTPKLLTI